MILLNIRNKYYLSLNNPFQFPWMWFHKSTMDDYTTISIMGIGLEIFWNANSEYAILDHTKSGSNSTTTKELK